MIEFLELTFALGAFLAPSAVVAIFVTAIVVIKLPRKKNK